MNVSSLNKALLVLSIPILLLCIYFQFFVYIPGNDIYLSQSGKIAEKVVLILEFMIFMLYYYFIEVKYISKVFFLLSIVILCGSIFLSDKYTRDLKNELIDEEPYVTIGIVAKFEYTKRMDRFRVYYNFKDLEGTTVSSAFTIDRKCVKSDTILVVFCGQHPNLSKIFNSRPSHNEINLYKDGAKMLMK